MNQAEKIRSLVQQYGNKIRVRRGFRLFGRRINLWTRCWLRVEESPDHWGVFRASGRDTHFPIPYGPVIAADFRKDTGALHTAHGLTGAYMTALSLWPVRDETKARIIYIEICALIDSAYAQTRVPHHAQAHA